MKPLTAAVFFSSIVLGVVVATSGDAQDVADQVLPAFLKRNFRQNNPFNVGPSPTGTWNGQTGIDDRGLPMFATLADGLRAGAINVLHGFIDHPSWALVDFGQDYAPWQHNPPAKLGDYGKAIALRLRAAPYDPYNVKSRVNFTRLLSAIIINENTDDPLTAGQYDQAATAAYQHFGL